MLFVKSKSRNFFTASETSEMRHGKGLIARVSSSGFPYFNRQYINAHLGDSLSFFLCNALAVHFVSLHTYRLRFTGILHFLTAKSFRKAS